MSTERYSGNELDIFRSAQNWKEYFSSYIKPYLAGHVLEVGAGNGSTTAQLIGAGVTSWTCLEPDFVLATEIAQLITKDEKFNCCEVINGSLSNLNPDNQFDVILYIDVLEHIENDHIEIEHVSTLLKPDGTLVILSPAHQWLYSEFDKSIGHFRRYNKTTLQAAIPSTLNLISIKYLDCVGVCLSLMNRLLLHQGNPNKKQIQFWDKIIVPVSRFIDPLVLNSLGKSIIGIWKKNK
ncbi:MAG: class I SAM-dependent methyltransferase [Gammaproteobacteria bacterium]|jgi:SAM-dependent methyltransferase